MSQSNSDLRAQIPALLPVPDVNRGRDMEQRRTRLREFQAHFLERMQAARSGVATHQNHLGFLIGQTRWLLDLQEAGEIVAIDRITKVPLAQDWYLGLTNIRGSLVSVVDFARFQGEPLTSIDKDSRIVAFSSRLQFNSALLVKRVLGLRNLEQMQLQTPEDELNDDGSKRYLDGDGQLWTELKLAQLIQDPRFLQVGL